jgi:phenylalanyl-tRNA synthetase beta chain
MRATLSWLREFVPCEMEPLALAEELTLRGLECKATWEGELEKVVVAEVLEVASHPKAERLHVCKVRAGSEVLEVVCGAPNVAPGVKAPLALPGCKLPGGEEVWVSEIRGVKSQGMLCSEAELGLGEDASGIWILPDHLRPGQRLDDELQLKDWVFSFDLTPNRADCLSILGLAFEVAAIERSQVRVPDVRIDEMGEAIHGRFHVEVLDVDLCPRYVARMIEGVKIGESPLWMRRRLQLVGLRSINNVVDVTNYVMWELGQPLHAFDLELLEGSTIVVKRAKEGEEFVSLDGQIRRLRGDMLMIWDAKKPVAVAGVMGGENSEVRPTTTSVLLESAYFDPMSIRRTAKALGMNTEASRRFERGVDPEGCPRAADRAAKLIAELAGGKVARGSLDVYPNPFTPREIRLRVSRVNELLGTQLTSGDVAEALRSLSLQVQEKDPGTFLVTPPTRRVDLTREIDLVEEVARTWGYEKIPSTIPKITSGKWWDSSWRQMEEKVREVMVGFGFHEVITFSFIDPKCFDALDLDPRDPLRDALELKNPLRPDQGIMRTTLLPGILEAVHRNFHRRNMDLRLFEIGRVFIPRKGELLPLEKEKLGGAISGARWPRSWSHRSEEVDFFDLKGVVEGLFGALKIEGIRFEPRGIPPFLEPGASSRIGLGDVELGWLGELKSEVMERLDLESRVLVFELDLMTMEKMWNRVPKFRPLPRYPEVVRDLSILVPLEVGGGEVQDHIEGMGLKWLERVVLFDVFQDPEKLPHGFKSLTFRIWYRSEEGSLKDEEVNEEQMRLVEGLERTFGARLRG